ncbi:MAG TPA: ABC transporter permease [Gemmatimonadaceae bacterium]|nr:ABC transporter permease [Gemmatimonadaceae bacterium]
MRSLARRIGVAALLLWLVLTITFALVRLAPGDAATLLVPPSATAADAERLRGELGLDASIAVQYARWLARALRGDLGESFVHARPVTAVLADALPLSVGLGLASLTLTFLGGVAVGMVQAYRRGRSTDVALTVATTALYAAPAFWLSLALVAVFTYGAARWGFPPALRLPAFGVRDPASAAGGMAAAADIARHAILPVATLALIGAAGVARYARTAIADVLDALWVRAVAAKGASRRRIRMRHVLPNALPPLIVLLALSVPGVLAGSVFVESIFAWPGMGRLMLSAIAARDYPVVLGATALYAALVIGANLAADLALPLLDPRRRS